MEVSWFSLCKKAGKKGKGREGVSAGASVYMMGYYVLVSHDNIGECWFLARTLVSTERLIWFC